MAIINTTNVSSLAIRPMENQKPLPTQSSTKRFESEMKIRDDKKQNLLVKGLVKSAESALVKDDGTQGHNESGNDELTRVTTGQDFEDLDNKLEAFPNEVAKILNETLKLPSGMERVTNYLEHVLTTDIPGISKVHRDSLVNSYLESLPFEEFAEVMSFGSNQRIQSVSRSMYLRDAENGDLVSIYPINSNGAPITAESSEDDKTDNYHLVEYVTEGEIAKFRISIPEGSPPEGGYPVLLWNHGTRGVSPSSTLSSSGEPIKMSEYNKSYIVIEPDYVEGTHRYGTYPDVAKSSLNALKATISSGLTSVDMNNIVLSGYSQGGAVSMEMLDLADTYMPEVKFKKAVLWAPGSDFPAHLQNLMNSTDKDGKHDQLWIAVLRLYSVAEAEENLELFKSLFSYTDSDEKPDGYIADYTDIKNNSGHHYNDSEEGKKWNNNISFTKKFIERAKSNDWEGTPWKGYFDNRVMGNLKTDTPILVINGKDDTIVGVNEVAALKERLIQHGNTVTGIEFSGGHHIIHKDNLDMFHNSLEKSFSVSLDDNLR